MLKDGNFPADLKKMSMADLKALAEEIRAELIRVVPSTGGHLASNLGIVELTIALHYVFSSPKDKIIFDVGHQAYVHKMLTGRFDRFSTLRQKGGLSGFPSMQESQHDTFTAGHASTSVSAALGLSRARDLLEQDYSVVAVLGDGALTGGMCYEALNDAGQSGARMIVILNDNEMSISRNVGALSAYLTGLRQSASYQHAKSSIRHSLEKIPCIGKTTVRIIERLRDSLKTMLVGDRFFEALGFTYSGPINGHDINSLIRALKIANHSERPVLLHVVTQKGHGYAPAVEHPAAYHGIASNGSANYDPSSGSAAAAYLVQLARENRTICSIVAAMPLGTCMDQFFQQYPERSFDVGIAEEHAVEMAAGLAAGGMHPFVAVYSTFLQRAVDQIQTDVCLPGLPVTFLIDRAGLVGEDGATHQGVFDLSYLGAIPEMTIAAPSNLSDLKRMIALSTSASGPWAIRYPKVLPEKTEAAPVSVGKGCTLRYGSDIALIAVGSMVPVAEETANLLAERGVSVTVIDARFVKPLDEAGVLQAARSHKLIATIEENVRSGGFGERVADCLNRENIGVPLAIFAVPDRFIKHATIEEQRKECGLLPLDIFANLFARLRSVMNS